MSFRRITCVLLLAAASVSCRQRDLRTVRIDVPEMKNEACVAVVRKALSDVSGQRGDMIRSVAVDLPSRSVKVTYDSLKLSLKNIEFAIAEGGFRANDIPADEKAAKALPAECRAGPETSE